MDLDPNDIPDDALDSFLSEIEAIQQISPLDYKPHPKQHDFHTSNKRIRLFSGGNRSGKTEAGTVEDVIHATGIYPSWYPKELQLNRANKGRVIVTDFAKGAATYEEKLFKWLPKELIVHISRTMKGSIEKVQIRHITGGTSLIEILTHEQDDDVFEGWSGHWCHFDEPPPKEKWTGTKRGLLDYHGRAWFTLTPIKEPWIHEEFVLSGDPDVEHIAVDMSENPYISKEEVDFYQRNMSEDDKDARIHGTFKYLAGRVYKELIPEIHVQPEKLLKIDKRWPIYFVLDPADRRPHRGIWARIDPFKTIYVVDEIEFTGNIKEVSKAILTKEISLGINPMTVTRLGDPNKMKTGSALSEDSGTTFQLEFAKHALYFICDIKDDLALGHLKVKELLMWDKTRPISLTNKPKIFFVKETTTRCLKQLMLYMWDDNRGSTKDSKDLKQKPKDLNKDFPDCLRYLVVFDPSGIVSDQADPTPFAPNDTTGYR